MAQQALELVWEHLDGALQVQELRFVEAREPVEDFAVQMPADLVVVAAVAVD